MELTQSRLKELLDYNPSTGLFYWKIKAAKNTIVGSIAGCKKYGDNHPHNYILIRIDKKLYRAHRLAWLYVHGVWPVDQLDHINRCSTDNRIENLREANMAQNTYNQKCRSNSISGKRGVAPADKGRWRAYIIINKKRLINLGYYDNLEDAANARIAAEIKYHGQFAASLAA